MCQLCQVGEHEKQWDEGRFYGLICKTCRVPMIVLKEHKAKLSDEERAEMIEIVKRRYSDKKLRGYMRSIIEHWHDHLL